jgi:transcriptional regulator with XRE-family HTH domain
MGVMAKRKPSRPRTVPSPKKLRDMREQKGWTVEFCAGKVGVSARTWRYWELPKQNRWPSPSHMILIRLLFSGQLPD